MYRKGFTLIELLVVIAIIGVLSAVVLSSLNTARNKGSDAAIQADLANVRTQATIYADENENYGSPVTIDASDCTIGLFSDPIVAAQIAAADEANGVRPVVCNLGSDGAVAVSYAVSAELVGIAGSYFCIDSGGQGLITATPLGVATSCS